MSAFAHHVVATWSYALSSNDAQPLLDLSPAKRPCAGCAALGDELKSRRADGWHVDLPGVDIGSTKLSGVRAEPVATMKISIPESASYRDDGSYRNTSPAHPDGTFTVEMRFVKGAFRLLSFSVT